MRVSVLCLCALIAACLLSVASAQQQRYQYQCGFYYAGSEQITLNVMGGLYPNIQVIAQVVSDFNSRCTAAWPEKTPFANATVLMVAPPVGQSWGTALNNNDDTITVLRDGDTLIPFNLPAPSSAARGSSKRHHKKH